MNRRSLLQLLAYVPCLGWVKPKERESGGFVVPKHLVKALTDGGRARFDGKRWTYKTKWTVDASGGLFPRGSTIKLAEGEN